MKRNTILLFAILFFLAFSVRLFFFFDWHEVWWDSGVYLGMGKYLFSVGDSGLWEHIRPVGMPVVLGFLWFVGLDSFFFGRIFEFAISLGSIILVFLISRKVFDSKTAIISSVVVAFSPVFFFLGVHLYNEIPAVFFGLLGVYALLYNRFFLAGVFFGFASTMKFPAGGFFAGALLWLVVYERKKTFQFAAGFLASLLPVFAINKIFSGSFLAPFFEGSSVITKVLGCNVLRKYEWWQYGYWLFFSESFLHVFSLFGFVSRKWSREKLLVLFVMLVPLIYFVQLPCREYRYVVLFLPFFAMFTSSGTVRIISFFEFKSIKHRNKIFAFCFLLVLLYFIWQGTLFYQGNEVRVVDSAAQGYFEFLKDKQVSGEVWTANPVVSAYTDAKLEKIYYPFYDEGVSASFVNYLLSNKKRVEFVFLDNCGGGIICHPEDAACKAQNQKMFDLLEKDFNKVYDAKNGDCYYKIYRS